MKIALCSSAKFFQKLPEIKEALESLGHTVHLPSMVDFHHLEETAYAKVQYDLIKEHFKKIDESDAVYIANFDKDGVTGYIGGNTFLEMGKAFDRNLPILLMKDIPMDMIYKDELLAMMPIVVGTDFSNLSKLI